MPDRIVMDETFCHPDRIRVVKLSYLSHQEPQVSSRTVPIAGLAVSRRSRVNWRQ